MPVGKNALENLTVAMYENSFTLFREFVQNSADSIDKAIASGVVDKDDTCIDISIEYSKRRITVYDNGLGLSMREFKDKMMQVADSDKDRNTDKGFRGIGRLAGLGYCDNLIFRSSFKGEDKESKIIWDGKKLRSVLNDPKQHPSSDKLIEMITSIEYSEAKNDDHYFEVIMEDVSFESDSLLNEEKVISYLSAVAPVPYANYFVFSSKIREFAQSKGFKLDEYHVLVNGNQVIKPYRTKLYEGNSKETKKELAEIFDVEFKVFNSSKGVPIAWMWLGISTFDKVIPVINEMRGIRLRKENIQIGDENTLAKFFKQERGNHFYIGELFAVDKELIPNARRDYFNQTPASSQFEKTISEFFYSELGNLYYFASKVKNAHKAIENYKKMEEEYNNKLSNAGFIDAEEEEAAKRELEIEKSKAEKNKREIENRKKEVDSKSEETKGLYNRVFNEIEKKYSANEKQAEPKNIAVKKEEKKGNKYLTQSLSKYSKKEQKLVSRIYSIIKGILPKDMADTVIQKIQEELSE